MNRDSDHMATLHLLNKPPAHPRFQACLDSLSPGDALLLMESAVIAVADGQIVLPESTSALRPDLAARGLSTVIEGRSIQVIDFLEMVDLTNRFPRTISW